MGRYPIEDWVTIACTYLIGVSADALRVYIIQHADVLPTWDDFTKFLTDAAGQRMVPEKAREALEAVRHSGTTAEFLLKFQQRYLRVVCSESFCFGHLGLVFECNVIKHYNTFDAISKMLAGEGGATNILNILI